MSGGEGARATYSIMIDWSALSSPRKCSPTNAIKPACTSARMQYNKIPLRVFAEHKSHHRRMLLKRRMEPVKAPSSKKYPGGVNDIAATRMAM